jgi:phosphotransferase system  glucose/maltose/N-acetylglucosamine-specific IIC component
MFLAPLLYLLHAVLTGISLFIATALGSMRASPSPQVQLTTC